MTELFSCSVTLTVGIRHFYCDNPSCGRGVFSESLQFTDKYGRMSHEACERVRQETLSQPSRSACATLSRQHITVSRSTCQRVARRLGQRNPDIRTSGYIGIDDFAIRKGHEYMCAAVDHYTRQVVAVFDSRYGHEIPQWIASHPEIRLVSRDGSQRYRKLIDAASGDIVQVSDRFHLMKNLRDVSVELIKNLLGERKARMPYPYPTAQEAYRYIIDDILGIGDARHRDRVRRYYSVRERKDAGETLAQIAAGMGCRPQTVYKYLNMDVSKVLNKEQGRLLRHAKEMSRIYWCPVNIYKYLFLLILLSDEPPMINSFGCPLKKTFRRKLIGYYIWPYLPFVASFCRYSPSKRHLHILHIGCPGKYVN